MVWTEDDNKLDNIYKKERTSWVIVDKGTGKDVSEGTNFQTLDVPFTMSYPSPYIENTDVYKGKKFAFLQPKNTNITEAVVDKSTQHNNICKVLNDKNHDYGDSFAKSYSEYKDVMAAIRLEDKLNRYKALIANKEDCKVKEESIEDTLLDLANYAIMTLIERGYKPQ